MDLGGGCLCGALRYRIAGEPVVALICHCASCRRASGAASVGWLTVPEAAFAWEKGTPALHASSPGVERGHCPACGTSLTWRGVAGEIDVTLASLDDPEAAPPPVKEVWLSHRLSWAPRTALPGFAEAGDD